LCVGERVRVRSIKRVEVRRRRRERERIIEEGYRWRENERVEERVCGM